MKSAALVVLLLCAPGCEIFRGYVREVRVAVPPPEPCVRKSMGEVPGATVYAHGTSEMGFWFNWSADQQALGSVSVYYGTDSGAVVGLKTGWLNSCSPAALARGRVVMDELYERLRVNCGGLPEASAVEQKRIRACD